MQQTYTVVALYNRVEGYSFGTYDKRQFNYLQKEGEMKLFVESCKQQKSCLRIIVIDDLSGECEQSTPDNWI